MTLEILICTFNDRINCVGDVLMPPMHNISYLVSWQQADGYVATDVPQVLKRDDVKVVTVQGTGLSNNRNNALSHASGDICLIADDDLKYIPGHVTHIFDIFESHPTIDIATFKFESSNYPKGYPSYSFDLQQPVNGYYITSFEIAFRRASVQGKVRFNPLFGPNAPVLSSGEESLFIYDALNMGLTGFFFPYAIVHHDHPTTATRLSTDPSHVMSTAAYIHLTCHDGTAPLRYVMLAWRSSCRNPFKFFKMLQCVLRGVKYIKKNYVPA